MISLYSLDFSKTVSARQKLETQVTENKIVKEVTQIFKWKRMFTLSNPLKKAVFSLFVGVGSVEQYKHSL